MTTLSLLLVLSFLGTTLCEDAIVIDYPVIDTNQETFWGGLGELASVPGPNDDYYGQDATYTINPPDLVDNGDGTVSDHNTGLMWTQDYYGRMSRIDADASTITLGGYTDWRIPSIQELYSLMDFRGLDPTSDDTSNLTPFIDTTVFSFAYGGDNGTRVIDVQFISSTDYVAASSSTLPDWFGVNFADGRIKGYDSIPPNFFARYVRGNTNYGVNTFTDNGDSTISDAGTGLMWEQSDSGSGMLWIDALRRCESQTTAGHTDWRLPSAKELHSIVDYTRSPDTSNSPAINALFSTSQISNENAQTDFPYIWTSTTHKADLSGMEGGAAVYFSFGRAMGFFDSVWQDVHGAGSQKSDPKTGNASDYPTGNGPQGDAIRIENYVRCVRTETSGIYGSPPTNAPTPAPTGASAPTPAPTDGDGCGFVASLRNRVQDWFG